MTYTSLLFTTALTAAAEVGDKSQMMALLLGLRFRRPVAIILGILVATVVNHLLTGLTTSWVAGTVDPQLLRWTLVPMSGAMAIWASLPDRIDRDSVVKIMRGGIVLAPALSFFLAEIGDKSELCAAVLTADSGSVGLVLVGTSAGVLIANAPLVLFGSNAGK